LGKRGKEMRVATIQERLGAKALDIIRLECGAYFWPVQWEDGSLHVAGIYRQAGGRYDLSDELAWRKGFGTVAELTRAVSAQLEAQR
jgi:hypothetical protein